MLNQRYVFCFYDIPVTWSVHFKLSIHHPNTVYTTFAARSDHFDDRFSLCICMCSEQLIILIFELSGAVPNSARCSVRFLTAG